MIFKVNWLHVDIAVALGGAAVQTMAMWLTTAFFSYVPACV
jgi:hypothetical protein